MRRDDEHGGAATTTVVLLGGSVDRAYLTQTLRDPMDVSAPGSGQVIVLPVGEPTVLAAPELAARLPVSDAIYGEKPLSQTAPTDLLSLSQEYRRLLEQSLESKAFSDQSLAASRSTAVVALASALASSGASPRDVIELHVATVTTAIGESGPLRARALETEGTILVLEVMGHLAAAYRLRALRPERDGA